jgi:hypothetical protein
MGWGNYREIYFDRTRIISRQLVYSDFSYGSVTASPALYCQPMLYCWGKGAIFPAKICSLSDKSPVKTLVSRNRTKWTLCKMYVHT